MINLLSPGEALRGALHGQERARVQRIRPFQSLQPIGHRIELAGREVSTECLDILQSARIALSASLLCLPGKQSEEA